MYIILKISWLIDYNYTRYHLLLESAFNSIGLEWVSIKLFLLSLKLDLYAYEMF